MIKKILKLAGALLLALCAVMIVKALLLKSRQIEVPPLCIPEISDSAILRLAGAIQIPTVSFEDTTQIDPLQFIALHDYLEVNFPNVFSQLKQEKYNRFGLLFEWTGSNPKLNPIVLMAHQDVVPVVAGEWEKDPFSAENDGTFLWGRGTLDDKGALIAILESVEMLLSEGFRPERTIFLAFGNDEEIGGKGARAIATALSAKGVEAEYVLDEGMVITRGMVPMINKPVALIGTSEKGYLSVELSCDFEGGHSSTPKPETAISILSEAVSQVTKHLPETHFTDPVNNFIRYIGPEIPWPARIVFANQWILGGLIKKIYSQTPAGDALIRTTTAPTILQAGVKDNVLPTSARAIINLRLLPGDSSKKIITHLNNAINDKRVRIKAIGFLHEPAPVSPIHSAGFKIIQKSIRQTYPETVIAPTLMLATSDSYYYSGISKNIYKFAPYQLEPEDLARIHGNNERIKIDDYKQMIGFYYRLIRNSTNK
jgi:carboxypeptidase PM20D1